MTRVIGQRLRDETRVTGRDDAMEERPPNTANSALTRHRAALQILRESDESRIPLAVYLRKFDMHMMHGPGEQERQFGEEMVLDALPEGARLLTVQEEPTGEIIRSALSDRVPAISLGADWKSTLRPILARAELIISEFTFLSEGVRWELETCRALGKHHQTVLILPPRKSPFACLDHLIPLDQFPRVLWADQFFRERIAESFAVQDLMDRLRVIAAFLPEERRKMYASGDMLQYAPVSYDGVFTGYKTRAKNREVQQALADEDPDAAYYRFWDWYRAASVLGVLVRELNRVSLSEAAFDLTYAYTQVLQGIAHRVVALDEEGSFLTSEMTRKMAASLTPLIDMLPEGPGTRVMRQYADATLERLGYS